MPLTVGTDTYVDVATADAYFAKRFGYDKWPTLPTEDKEKLLASAAQELDLLCEWFGDKCDPKQALAFPRTLTCPNVPKEVQTAQMEIAYLMLEAGSAFSGSSSTDAPLQELKAGSVSLKFDTKRSVNTTGSASPWASGLVASLLENLGYCSFGSTRLVPIERQ